MAWQDEVRRLDEELAAGRLSPDEHQRRRDELVAQAGGEQPEPAEQSNPPAQTDRLTPAAPGGGPSEPGAEAGPDNRGNQHSPFPPAFRWDNTPQNETTQVISPVAGNDAERTQVVHTPAPPPPPVDDSERTQVVQAGPPAPPRFGGPYAGDYPGGDNRWAQSESAPPWVSSDPIQEPNAGWMMQGPESFEAEPKDSGTMRIVAVAAAVVVLLAVGIGAYFLFQPGGSSTTAGDETNTAAQPPPPAPAPGGDAAQPAPNPPPEPEPAPAPQPQGPPIASLPGEQLDTSEFQDFAQVRQLGYYTEAELETMYAAGPGEAALALSTQDNNKLIILVVRADDPAAARDELADLQLQFELDELDGRPGVRVAGSDDVPDGDPVLRRAHYASGDYVVRVQASGDSVSEVEQLFDEILGSQQQKLAADG